MGQKRYFWLKLFEDFFSSKRIKKLRSLAGGDTYTIIYLKMQLKALKTDGYLYFDGVMNDFAEEIALDIDENPEDVKVTIQYLLSVGLIECSESGEEYYLSYMKNIIGSESASTQRSRECRARKKEQEALQCNTTATPLQQVGNAEIDIEKEKEKKNIKKKNFPPTVKEVEEYCRQRGNGIDAQAFVDFYDARSWYSGKTKLTNWKKCVNTWERRKGFVFKPKEKSISQPMEDQEDEWTDEEFFNAVDTWSENE